MAFELEPYDFRNATGFTSTAVILAMLHQFSVLAGILAMWFGADKVMHWLMKQHWFNHASGFSFFIFGLHVPLLPYMMTWAMMTLSFLPYCRLICYLVVPLTVLVFSVWMGSLVRHFVPALYRLLTGGRGF